MAVFSTKYLNNSKIANLSKTIYNDIRQAYYGGVCEVFPTPPPTHPPPPTYLPTHTPTHTHTHTLTDK